MSKGLNKIWIVTLTLLVSLYWVVLLFMFMGCSSDAEPIELSESCPITFGLQNVGTRASSVYADGSIPSGNKIGVFAYEQGTADWSSTTHEPNLMYNQWMQVGNGGSLSYFPLHFWPNDESKKLSFVAYYPYSETHSAQNGVLIDQTNIRKGSAKIEFRQLEKASEQTDFLISKWNYNQVRTNGQQTFTFNHMLAKVKITVTGKAATKVTLKNVCMSAYVDFLGTDTPSWLDNISYPKKYGTATIDLYTDSDNSILLMIPQTTENISITVYYNGGSKTGTLPTTFNSEWEAGKSYEYKITVN